MTVTHYAEVQTELMGIQKKGDLGDFEPGASCWCQPDCSKNLGNC